MNNGIKLGLLSILILGGACALIAMGHYAGVLWFGLSCAGVGAIVLSAQRRRKHPTEALPKVLLSGFGMVLGLFVLLTLVFAAMGVPFSALYYAFSAFPLKQWVVPNYHDFSQFKNGTYQRGDIAFPGERVNINLGVPSLQGAIRIKQSYATTPGYDLAVLARQEKEVQGAPIGDKLVYKDVPTNWESGAIALTLPSDERLYEKSLPILYSASVSRPVAVGDRQHYSWESTNIEGTVVINMGTRAQARNLEMVSLFAPTAAGLLTLCFGIWLAKSIYRHVASHPTGHGMA